MLPKLLTPTATAQQSNTSETNYKNQEFTEEELEEEPPDILDTQMAIQSMKYNKSPGIDNIPAELYKRRGGLLLNTLHLEGREDSHGLEKIIIVLDQVSATLKTVAVIFYDTQEHSFLTWCCNPN